MFGTTSSQATIPPAQSRQSEGADVSLSGTTLLTASHPVFSKADIGAYIVASSLIRQITAVLNPSQIIVSPAFPTLASAAFQIITSSAKDVWVSNTGAANATIAQAGGSAQILPPATTITPTAPVLITAAGTSVSYDYQ